MAMDKIETDTISKLVQFQQNQIKTLKSENKKLKDILRTTIRMCYKQGIDLSEDSK